MTFWDVTVSLNMMKHCWQVIGYNLNCMNGILRNTFLILQ